MKHSWKWVLAVSLVVGLVAPPGWVSARPVVAGQIVVTTTLDAVKGYDGVCSLREAVINANNNSASSSNPGECAAGLDQYDVIYLPDKPVTLTIWGGGENYAETGDLDIREGVSILGYGATRSEVDGNGVDRVFDLVLPGANLYLAWMRVSNGQVDQPGGAVAAGGGVTVGSSNFFHANSVEFVNNRATGYTNNWGGAVYVLDGTATAIIENSTFLNNQSGSGGAIASSGVLTITNSTFSGNYAQIDGGGIANTGQLWLRYSTLAYNDPNAVQTGWGAATVMQASILAWSTYLDCSTNPSGVLTGSYNVISDASCNLPGVSGNRTSIDPRLGPLGLYGMDGITRFFPLLRNSAAIEWVPNTAWRPTYDQRNVSRPQDGDGVPPAYPDVGAVEMQLGYYLQFLPVIRK